MVVFLYKLKWAHLRTEITRIQPEETRGLLAALGGALSPGGPAAGIAGGAICEMGTWEAVLGPWRHSV